MASWFEQHVEAAAAQRRLQEFVAQSGVEDEADLELAKEWARKLAGVQHEGIADISKYIVLLVNFIKAAKLPRDEFVRYLSQFLSLHSKTIRAPRLQSSPVSFAWSPDSRQLATLTNADEKISLYDAQTGAELAPPLDPAPDGDPVCVDRVDSRYAMGFQNSNRVLIWDVARPNSGTVILNPGPNSSTHSVINLQWSIDKKRLAVQRFDVVRDRNGPVEVYDTDMQKMIFTTAPRNTSPSDNFWANGDRWLVVDEAEPFVDDDDRITPPGGFTTLSIYETEPWTLEQKIELHTGINSYACAHNRDSVFIVVTQTREFFSWSARDGLRPWKAPSLNSERGEIPAMSSRGDVAVFVWIYDNQRAPVFVNVFRDEVLLKRIPVPEGNVGRLSWSPAGDKLAWITLNDDDQVRLHIEVVP